MFKADAVCYLVESGYRRIS